MKYFLSDRSIFQPNAHFENGARILSPAARHKKYFILKYGVELITKEFVISLCESFEQCKTLLGLMI